jgi:hypothetical protein
MGKVIGKLLLVNSYGLLVKYSMYGRKTKIYIPD